MTASSLAAPSFTANQVGTVKIAAITPNTEYVVSVKIGSTTHAAKYTTGDVNTANVGQDTYYSRFIADDSVSGNGHWQEFISPEASTGLNAATMPHELVNTGTNAFTFRQATWTERLVGDGATNSHPSFVDQKILLIMERTLYSLVRLQVIHVSIR